jgi:hypothetical protein
VQIHVGREACTRLGTYSVNVINFQAPENHWVIRKSENGYARSSLRVGRPSVEHGYEGRNTIRRWQIGAALWQHKRLA